MIKELIKKHEGTNIVNGRHMPYRCTAGKLTIGIGRNLDDKGISDMEADAMLDNDIKECVKQCVKHIPAFYGLDIVRQDALIDMCFNMGINSLLGFKNTLDHIEKREWKEAAEGIRNSKYAQQVKGRAVRISNMIETGKYPDDI